MSWNEKCVGREYNKDYSDGIKFSKKLGSIITNIAKDAGINPATLATIASMETLSGRSADDATNSNCDSCYKYGVGVCQVGKAMFDDFNKKHGNEFTWCVDICEDYFERNLQICAEFLKAAFRKAKSMGYTNQTQVMAMAATSWNGNPCKVLKNSSFKPWGNGSWTLGNPDNLTAYGATAGYLFSHSGYAGKGVFDTSIKIK